MVKRYGIIRSMETTPSPSLYKRYLPDNRKIGKSDVRRHCKPLEVILKKTAEKHAKYAKAVLTPLCFGTKVR